MEDSRKRGEKQEKKDFHHLIHTWMEEMVKKAIVYNTKKEEKKRARKKNRLKKKERKKERTKRVEEIQQQKGRI